jgi:hypothetical protein
MVLVEQQMELIERNSRNLPVMFLVHVPKSDGIGQKLIQIFNAFCTNYFVQGDGQSGNLAERLNFRRMLMERGLGAARAFFELAISRAIFVFFADHGGLSSFELES